MTAKGLNAIGVAATNCAIAEWATQVTNLERRNLCEVGFDSTINPR